MEMAHARDIFAQIATVDGPAGVRVILETHDAWTHAPSALLGLTPAHHLHIQRMNRPPATNARISQQRHRLAALVTTLPQKSPSAP